MKKKSVNYEAELTEVRRNLKQFSGHIFIDEEETPNRLDMFNMLDDPFHYKDSQDKGKQIVLTEVL